MVYKTIYRAAYNDITIDSQKINEQFINAFENNKSEFDSHETTEDVTHEIVTETAQTPVVFEIEAETVVTEKATETKVDQSNTPEITF
jgi:recombination protein RecT